MELFFNHMIILNILATIIGILMSLAHFPQAYKLYQHKSVKDISLLMYSIFTIGAYIWLIYGIALKELPIIISFSVATIGTTLVLILILKYRKN